MRRRLKILSGISRGTMDITILVATASVVYADDAPADLKGQSLMPIQNHQVQLVRETILIETHVAVPSKSNFAKAMPVSSEVKAHLEFRNLSEQPQTVTLAFPVDDWDVEYGERRNPRPDNPYDFSTVVDHHPVTPALVVAPASNRYWYLWQQVFPVRQIVAVDHHYRVSWGGKHIPPGIYNAGYWRYILSTGALWAGAIESVKIELKFDGPIDPHYLYVTPDPATVSATSVQWALKDLKPKSDVSIVYSWADPTEAKALLEKIKVSGAAEGVSLVKEISSLKIDP